MYRMRQLGCGRLHLSYHSREAAPLACYNTPGLVPVIIGGAHAADIFAYALEQSCSRVG